MRAVAVCAFLALAAGARSTPPPPEVANVAAFARLYGVARFFYPSDAAAALDWDRFAVLGVARVRSAPDAAALATTLRELFEPLGPGFVVARELPTPEPATGEAEGPAVAWQYLGPGFGGGAGPYQARRTNRRADPSIDGFVTVMQTVPADALRGGEIRMRGRARARVEGDGWGALWLRVDRADRRMGFFDNMGDRQIRDDAWTEYVIEGPVAEDADQVAFGVMASGVVRADFDAIELLARPPGGAWESVPVEDAGFEADPDSSPWFRTGSSANAVVERVAGASPQGRQLMRLASPPGGIPPPLLEDVLPRAGDHVDMDLGVGLRARVPTALSDSDARDESSTLAALIDAVATQPLDAADPHTRLADVVVAWNVFRHFYPYWDVAGVDWDAELRPLIAEGFGPAEGHRDALRRLVAGVRDGHGGVHGFEEEGSRASLPLKLRVIEGRVAVTASSAPDRVPVGAVIRSIDGRRAEALLERATALASGSEQWRRVRAMRDLERGARAETATLELEDPDGVREVSLRYTSNSEVPEPRPEPLAEIADGVLYVDLTRARMADVEPELGRLAAARGVVFDVRGYPTDAGARILTHLIDAPERTRWMHVARIAAPFGRWTGWNHIGWDLEPAPPRIGGRRIFLTDGRAISYAESVMGYVADLGLGTILGAPTAATNGNVKRVLLPSGAWINFTGMKVTRHDGESPHHLVGVQPDVAVEPTIEGIRAGRDELLERALELLSEGA